MNKRDLPWRHTRDPYLIWVSEVILQQTRVEQGLAYYRHFTERFPDVESLAMAEEEEVMKIWQGLGYYTRARNLHHSARYLYQEHNAVFPASYLEIKKLKGIGEYSASAISSIAFGEARPVIDGNVMRVVSRYAGIHEPVSSSPGKKKIQDFLQKQINHEDPGTFNQAVMELGALVCKPKQPACDHCPVRQDCYAFNNGLIDELPVIARNKPPETRYFHYLIITGSPEKDPWIWVRKRTGVDIWKNLYDFPLIETEKSCSLEELKGSVQWKTMTGTWKFSFGPVVDQPPYLLTHRRLIVRFIILRSDDFFHPNFLKIRLEEFHKYPVPRLIENILKKVASQPGIFLKFPD